MLADTLALLKAEQNFLKFVGDSEKGCCLLKTNPLLRTVFLSLSSIMKDKGMASQLKTHLVDVFKSQEDAVATLAELLTLVFASLR